MRTKTKYMLQLFERTLELDNAGISEAWFCAGRPIIDHLLRKLFGETENEAGLASKDAVALEQ